MLSSVVKSLCSNVSICSRRSFDVFCNDSTFPSCNESSSFNFLFACVSSLILLSYNSTSASLFSRSTNNNLIFTSYSLLLSSNFLRVSSNVLASKPNCSFDLVKSPICFVKSKINLDFETLSLEVFSRKSSILCSSLAISESFIFSASILFSSSSKFLCLERTL